MRWAKSRWVTAAVTPRGSPKPRSTSFSSSERGSVGIRVRSLARFQISLSRRRSIMPIKRPSLCRHPQHNATCCSATSAGAPQNEHGIAITPSTPYICERTSWQVACHQTPASQNPGEEALQARAGRREFTVREGSADRVPLFVGEFHLYVRLLIGSGGNFLET